MKKSEIRSMIKKMVVEQSRAMNEDTPNVHYSKDGYVKSVTLDGKQAKEIIVNKLLYRFNKVYKTYNSIKGNMILHKYDAEKYGISIKK